ncbi:MAG: class I adenylate-forming enzyme family protein, partial [Microthrixaceae bacterium]
MNLDQTVREASARFGERSAYVSPTGWEMSYASLDRLADEVAAALAAEGVSEGSVVAAVMPPRPEYVVAQVAAARVGAAFAGINHKLSPDERSALLELCDPAMLIDGGDAASGEDEALADLRAPSSEPPRIAGDSDRPLAIVFTSGSTGSPKGAVFAQRQIDFITQVETGRRWGDPGQRAAHGMSAMSLTHLGPTTKLQAKLMRGGTTHLLERWSPTKALELLERHRMPMIAGVPTQVTLMLRHADFGQFDLSSVQAVVMGGGPASPWLIREVRERLDVPVMVRYSCTEAGVGTGTSSTDDPTDAECSVGRPHQGVELTVRNATGGRLPHGKLGEVCLS